MDENQYCLLKKDPTLGKLVRIPGKGQNVSSNEFPHTNFNRILSIGCLVGGIRRASVVAKTTCELQALSRKNLNILVIEYPDVGDELKRVAKDRAKVVKEGNVATEEANLQCDETVNCEEEGGRGRSVNCCKVN